MFLPISSSSGQSVVVLLVAVSVVVVVTAAVLAAGVFPGAFDDPPFGGTSLSVSCADIIATNAVMMKNVMK